MPRSTWVQLRFSAGPPTCRRSAAAPTRPSALPDRLCTSTTSVMRPSLATSPLPAWPALRPDAPSSCPSSSSSCHPRSFASLFNSEASLVSCLEAGHTLVLVAVGVRGIAPVRAALSWTPVLAHAGSSRVAVFYVADSQPSAAYLVEWDTWREAGVSVWCAVPPPRRGSLAAHLPSVAPQRAVCRQAARSPHLLLPLPWLPGARRRW